jgi:hypothetical protein
MIGGGIGKFTSDHDLVAAGEPKTSLSERSVVQQVWIEPGAIINVPRKGSNLVSAHELDLLCFLVATYLTALIEGIGQTKEIVLLAAGLLVLFLYFKEPAGAILAATGLTFWLYSLVVGRLPSITLAQLHRAVEWHRWEDVLRLVERMEHFRRILRTRIPENCLQRFRAIALAALGKLDEALAHYPPEKNEDSYPDWLQHSLLAGVYILPRETTTAPFNVMKRQSPRSPCQSSTSISPASTPYEKEISRKPEPL